MNRRTLRPPLTIISANRAVLLGLGLLASMALPACRGEGPPPEASAVVTEREVEARAVDRADDRPVILFVGTSLTAGYGLDPSEAFPALIQDRVDAAGLDHRVVGAGVSGETSAGARRRMDWLLRQPVAVLVLETGANDGLRGQDPEATRDNIQAILDRAREQDPPPKLVLVAMEALPNYGREYREGFRAIYPELARENGATLIPFLLEGVAGDPELNQADGIHPNAAGEKRVAQNIWKALEPILRHKQ